MTSIDHEVIRSTLSNIGNARSWLSASEIAADYPNGESPLDSGLAASQARRYLDAARECAYPEGSRYWKFVGHLVEMQGQYTRSALRSEEIAHDAPLGLWATFARRDRTVVEQLGEVLSVLNPQPADPATFMALHDTPLPATDL